MPPRRLTSRQNPIVARARAAASGQAAEVLLEGLTLVTDARAAGWMITLVAMTDREADTMEGRALLESTVASERLLVTDPVVRAMSPAKTPSGILALAKPSRQTALADLRHAASLVLCAIDVQDPGNLGAILRVAEAAGATAAVAAGSSADPFGWKALRGAMGSAFRLPVVRRADVGATIAAARDAGCQLVASGFGGLSPDVLDLTGPTALFVGAEGAGLPEPVLAACTTRVSVPMAAPVESLNVAVATGIILYEARRQRQAARSGD